MSIKIRNVLFFYIILIMRIINRFSIIIT